MQTWFQLLEQKLNLADLTITPLATPFSITGVAAEWRSSPLEQLSETDWRLNAYNATGLEAQWYIRSFHDTRAVECWGQVTHRGHEAVAGVRECLGLDLALGLPPAFGQPWVRSVNGVRFLPNYFPPYDFAVVDRQLIYTPQVYLPLTLTGLTDGRSSGEALPCAIFTNEKQTEGLALFLEWSGLWRIGFGQQPCERNETPALWPLRLQAGLWGLQLNLQPGQSLPLPRVLLTAFAGDLESGGNALRRHIRRHVTPKLGDTEVLPPTSFNHWFAFSNNFTAESLKPAVEVCAQTGLEYFCVDGGWFTGGFRTGIGNWEEGDPAKFPGGIAPFADYVRSRGLNYGTWFEPEWAHKESLLYRQQPEWFWPSPEQHGWETPGNPFCRPEFHLMNFGLHEVQQWWLDRIVRAYEEWGVRWIRWDYNQMPRPNWEHGVSAGAVGWRQIDHITGFYRVLDEILAACPELLIEQCASGGHRIDLGTIRRGHTFWMNDHTTQSDIVRALQHGLNTVLPGNYPNTNLCQKRHDFTDYDFLSHGAGGFGYSGRLWEAPAADLARFTAAVQRFKNYRALLLGDYQRPTGQPNRADEYAKVCFSDAGSSVTLEFNQRGQRDAFLQQT